MATEETVGAITLKAGSRFITATSTTAATPALVTSIGSLSFTEAATETLQPFTEEPFQTTLSPAAYSTSGVAERAAEPFPATEAVITTADTAAIALTRTTAQTVTEVIAGLQEAVRPTD